MDSPPPDEEAQVASNSTTSHKTTKKTTTTKSTTTTAKKAEPQKTETKSAGSAKSQTVNAKVQAQSAQQKEVDNWNKQHPQNKVTLKNGKYSTIVSSNLGKHEVTANSFDELKTKVNEHLKKANASNTTKYSTGGYTGLGRMMKH